MEPRVSSNSNFGFFDSGQELILILKKKHGRQRMLRDSQTPKAAYWVKYCDE
jgi:hypothetical protein